MAKLKLSNYALIGSAWIALIFATSLLIFKTYLHSDSLFLQDLSRDLLTLHGHWSDWRFTPAPAYFPDMVLYLIAYKIFAAPVACIFFVTLCQAILIALSGVWLAKKIKLDLAPFAQASILLFVAFISFTAAHSGMWMYFNTTNNHIPALLLSIVCLGFLLDCLENARGYSFVLLTLFAALGILCDPIFLISFYTTALVALFILFIFLWCIKNTTPLKKLGLASFITLLAAFPLGKLLAFFITYNAPFEGRLNISYDGIENSWNQFLQATKSIVLPFNIYIILFTLVVLGATFYLLYLFFRTCVSKQAYIFHHTNSHTDFLLYFSKNYRLTFIALFLFLLIPINWIGAIASGGFADFAGYRYFMLPIGLIILLALIHLDYRLLPKYGRRFTMLTYGITIILLIGTGLQWKKMLGQYSLAGVKQILQWGVPTSKYESLVTVCLENLQKQHVVLHSGISDYWHARSVSYRLPTQNFIMPTDPTFSPFFWMSTVGPLRYPDKYKIFYNFVITHNASVDDPFHFTLKNIEKILPSGFRSHPCTNAPFTVLVYQGDALNTLLQQKIIPQFLFQVGKGEKQAIWQASQLPSNTGQIADHTRIAISKRDKAGFLIYGIYMKLKQGKYQVSLRYSASNHRAAQNSIGYWEIGKFDGPHDVIIGKWPLLPAHNATLTKTIVIPYWGLSDTEIRAWYSGQGKLTLSTIGIKKLDKRK